MLTSKLQLQASNKEHGRLILWKNQMVRPLCKSIIPQLKEERKQKYNYPNQTSGNERMDF